MEPEPVVGRRVNVYRNGVKIASVLTSSVGYYSAPTTIKDDGLYEIYSEFTGDAEYEGCDEWSSLGLW